MKYILDMVHHNPGEPPFQTRFLNPAHLADYGFNGQVFKHINCVATFAATGVDCFPAGSPERAWLKKFTPGIEREIAAAKARGLKGEDRHAFVCKGLHWSGETDRSRLRRLLKEFPEQGPAVEKKAARPL